MLIFCSEEASLLVYNKYEGIHITFEIIHGPEMWSNIRQATDAQKRKRHILAPGK
jgi:hypothetical protein